MNILSFARELLRAEKIEYVSALALADCRVVRPYLLSRAGIGVDGSAIVFAVPYYALDEGERNLSLYALSRDYHLYFSQLFERILPRLRERFSGHIFEGFADHSPIDEIDAAAKGGLGVVGKNGLIITEKYSSYVFLGEIICSAKCGEIPHRIKECENCGKCAAACPVHLDKGKCLSAISQKKGELTDAEKTALFTSGSVWGCDICQNACPHSEKAENTQIDFFWQKRLNYLKTETIENMSDEDFAERAYSWRGRDVILRNLRIFGSKDE
ncbi:MAG: epoxyqueuosine reductase [Clostridia bacterium]|nr:epoxyqueuosine reductase [Clostridia bacterium]